MKRILIIIILNCSFTLNTYAQFVGYNFCKIVENVNNASSETQLETIMSDYLKNTLDSYVDTEIYPGPLNGLDAQKFKTATLKNIKNRASLIGNVFNPKSLNEQKETAKKVIEFLNEVCETDYTKDPGIRFFKILDKILDAGKKYTGEYAFIVELAKIYIEATIKALELIRKVSFDIAEGYLNTGASSIVVSFSIQKPTLLSADYYDPDKLIKKVSIDLVDDEGNVYEVDKVSQYWINNTGEIFPNDKGSTTYDKNSVKVYISNIKDCTCRYALRLKISNYNTMYIPIHKDFAVAVDGGVYWKFRLVVTQGSLNTPEYAQFKIY